MPATLLLAAVSFCTTLCGCSCRLDPSWMRQAPQVKYRLPVSFRGAIAMSVVVNGSQPQRTPEGTYEIDVPESGVVALSSDAFLQAWHGESAVFADGSPLPNGTTLANDDARSIAFWNLYTDGHETVWNFVGSRAERDRALAEVPLQPGRQQVLPDAAAAPATAY